MLMIERSDLEQGMSVDAAGRIVQSFFDDRETYPDYGFYGRASGPNVFPNDAGQWAARMGRYSGLRETLPKCD
jgi:hypothetical protein